MHLTRPLLSLTLLPLVLALSCSKQAPPAARTVTLLHANDTYRILGLPEADLGGFARLRTLRTRLEADGPVLLTHAGDLLSPSLLSQRTGGAHMIDAMNHLDGDGDAHDPRLVVTPGNHEFDADDCEDADDLEDRFDESGFDWIATNIRWGGKPGSGCEATVTSRNVHLWRLIEVGDVTVGVISATTAKKHPAYVADFADPLDTLAQGIPGLRAEGADVVVALTHLGVEEDRALLRQLPVDARPDVLLGGHDHAAISEQVEGTWLLKADADLLSAQVVSVRLEPDGTRAIRPRLVALDASVVPDPAVQALSQAHVQAFDTAWCEARKLPPTCLSEPLGKVATDLVVDEYMVRTRETSAGNWLADLALEAGRPHGANVALLNSGSLRINRNLPAGTAFTTRHMEELFPFPSGLHLVRVRGSQIQQALNHSVQGWTGSGHFLQVGGLRFVHDPDEVVARNVEIQAEDGTFAPLDPRARYLAVVPRYLVDPAIGDQDGYTMLLPSDVMEQVPMPSLRSLAEASLQGAADAGIAPEVDGRICNARLQDCPPPPGSAAPGE